MSVFVLDPTIFADVNAGSEPTANQLNQLRTSGARLYVTRQQYTDLARVPANAQMLRDLGVQALPDDKYAANIVMHRRMTQLQSGDPTSVALALHLSETLRTNVKLMTTDPAAAREFQRYYGNVLAVMGGARKNWGVVDYNQTRRLLRLKPLAIGADGKVLPNPAKAAQKGKTLSVRPDGTVARPPKIGPLKSSTPPPATIDGKAWSPKPASPMSRGGNPDSPKTGQPPKVDPKVTSTRPLPSTSKQERGTGVKFVFQGVNYILQAINDHIQKQRYLEKWAVLSPKVAEYLSQEPTLGALVRVYYYREEKKSTDRESPMDYTNVFTDIRIAYGMTREDALANFDRKDQISAAAKGSAQIDDSTFIPPQQPVDFTKLQTPFDAAGLATFIPGREAFTHLQWVGPPRSFVRRGETKFKAPIKLPEAIRFLYLSPPSEISYRENKFRFETKEIDWDYQDAGETVDFPGVFYPGVPALDTDSLLAYSNLLNAQREKNLKLLKQRAVMVFPVNETTAKMFAAVSSLADNNGELAHIPWFRKSVRFVHPARLRVLQYFGK